MTTRTTQHYGAGGPALPEAREGSVQGWEGAEPVASLLSPAGIDSVPSNSNSVKWIDKKSDMAGKMTEDVRESKTEEGTASTGRQGMTAVLRTQSHGGSGLPSKGGWGLGLNSAQRGRGTGVEKKFMEDVTGE